MRTVPDAMNLPFDERSMFMIFGLLSRVIIPPLSRTLISALQPGLASWFLMSVFDLGLSGFILVSPDTVCSPKCDKANPKPNSDRKPTQEPNLTSSENKPDIQLSKGRRIIGSYQGTVNG